MANLKMFKATNLGTSQTGQAANVYFRLLWADGTTYLSRRNTGVYELVAGTGHYGSSFDVRTDFSGSIVWDVDGTSVYALEEIETAVDLRFTRFMTTGRWIIDENTNEMIFYKDDNTTEIARFDLKDSAGNGAVDAVFERLRSS